MTILINGKVYEEADTWPQTTRILNLDAFQAATTRYRGGDTFTRRGVDPKKHGKPQLTWFSGEYKIPAHDHRGNYISCQWPMLVTPMKNGRRECVEPGKLTPEQIAELDRQQRIHEEAMEEAIADLDVVDRSEEFSRVTGLGAFGASESEDKAVAEITRSYRTTELLLAVAMGLGLMLVLRK